MAIFFELSVRSLKMVKKIELVIKVAISLDLGFKEYFRSLLWTLGEPLHRKINIWLYLDLYFRRQSIKYISLLWTLGETVHWKINIWWTLPLPRPLHRLIFSGGKVKYKIKILTMDVRGSNIQIIDELSLSMYFPCISFSKQYQYYGTYIRW